MMNKIQVQKAKNSILEFKDAHGGTPEKLYNTLYFFSNQVDIRTVERATMGVPTWHYTGIPCRYEARAPRFSRFE